MPSHACALKTFFSGSMIVRSLPSTRQSSLQLMEAVLAGGCIQTHVAAGPCRDQTPEGPGRFT